MNGIRALAVLTVPSLLAVGGVVGCFVADVGDIGNTAIACDVETDCPDPLFCDGTRCREASAGDTTPPGVTGGSVHLDSTVLRRAATTTLSFVPTEALGETPQLAGDGLSFGDVTDTDGTFTATLTVAGDAAEGSRDIEVVLADVAGNTSEPVFLASLVVDATPPGVEQSQVPATVAPGTAIRLGVDATEPLLGARCDFDPVFGGATIGVEAVIDGARATCVGPSFELSTTAVGVSAELVDLAGNVATVDLGSVSIFDVP
jgi:hypothetical protein